MDVTATLIEKYRKEKDRKEWALVSKKDHSKVLRWFGTRKPSEERVKKEEKRIQYFKHANGMVTADLKNLGVYCSDDSIYLIDIDEAKRALEGKLKEDVYYAVEGGVEFRKNAKFKSAEITAIYAQSGYGPLLVDLLAERVSPEGVVMDQRPHSVSAAAAKMWKKLCTNPDYYNFQVEDSGFNVNYPQILRSKSDKYLKKYIDNLKKANFSQEELNTIMVEADHVLRFEIGEAHNAGAMVVYASDSYDFDMFMAHAGQYDWDVEKLMSADSNDVWKDHAEDAGIDFKNQRARKVWAEDQNKFMIDSGDPSMLFDEPTLVDNNTWLIHFTNSNPYDIMKNGFRGREWAIIGLTTSYKSTAYPGDLALAYKIDDVPVRDFAKYGDNAVIFKASQAARAYHHGDEENQVIFVTKSAHSMHPVFKEDGELVLYTPEGRTAEIVSKFPYNNSGLDKLVERIESGNMTPDPDPDDAEATMAATREDKIPGGLADKKDITDFDQEALLKGAKVEMEHTSDHDMAIEIAMDHLTEDPEYYNKLEKMEAKDAKSDFDPTVDELIREVFNDQELFEIIQSPKMEDALADFFADPTWYHNPAIFGFGRKPPGSIP